MKKTEKLIASIVTVALGVLLIALKGVTVQIVTSIFGILLIVLGVLNLTYKETGLGAAECAFGILIVAFGWLISSVVLYVISVFLFIIAVWWIFELWRARCVRSFSWSSLLQYAQPFFGLFIGFEIAVVEQNGCPHKRIVLSPERVVVTHDADARTVILYVITAFFAAVFAREAVECFSVGIRRALPVLVFIVKAVG